MKWWTMTTTLLLCLPSAAASCAWDQARIENLDNGRTVIDGVELQPDLPLTLDCSCSTVPCWVLVEAGTWWNNQIAEKTDYDRPVVLVRPIPPLVEATRGCFRFDTLPPDIMSVEVGDWTGGRLQGDWVAYIESDGWWKQVVWHAIGHALGLADDPPTTETLDLRSIMQADAPSWGEVTRHDARLVTGDQ